MKNLIRDLSFKEIAETKPDAKHRVTLGKLPFRAHHYKVFVNESGQIVLDPQVTIPASEAWLFKNRKAKSAILRGLADARAGRLVKAKEDFSKYLREDKP